MATDKQINAIRDAMNAFGSLVPVEHGVANTSDYTHYWSMSCSTAMKKAMRIGIERPRRL